MEIKEVTLKALVPNGRRLETKEETWYTIKFGDKEFLMPKQVMKDFTKKIHHESEFSLYFDGNKIFTNHKLHIPVEIKEINSHNFVVLKDDVELFKPENFTLLAKENGLSLYMINNNDISTIYRSSNVYRVINFLGRTTIAFDKEKPLDDETYNLVKRLASYHKAKHIKVNGQMAFFNIRILDHNDVKVYTTENASEYRIFLVENAEFAKVNDEMYVAIKGNQTYMVMNSFYMPIETTEHNNHYEGYEYITPNIVKVLHKENQEYSVDERKTVFVERTIVEIPNIDSEIIVRKVTRKAEPVIKRNQTKLSHNMLEPEIVEEKTYKIRDFLNKPVELDDWLAMIKLGCLSILFVCIKYDLYHCKIKVLDYIKSCKNF